MAGVIVVRPGETVTVVGAEADPNAPRPSHPIMLPGMPGWGVPPGARPSHPIALPGDPWWGGGGQVDPGWSGGVAPPPMPTHPIALPGDPWWGQDLKPTHPIVLPPIEPPTEPPPVQPPPADSGHWVWAWSPQLNRWVWVKVPGEGEAGPKA
jgi:hypothetical protein